jgi:DNA-binding winged helix-turn-helix (wHTH) protein/tetratricopeptide (TPR) repeat protein
MRFGPFQLDPKAAELRRNGEPVKLSPQPAKLLAILAHRSGEVVTRDEIRREMWCDTFVDFDQGLNFCIKQIREALGDHAGAPKYIETLPRRGYRFLHPVQNLSPAAPAPSARLIVLPFRMLKPDAETEFLAFSLAEAITTSLSGLEALIVRSSVAAARFAGNAPDLERVAADADVDFVLYGSLLRAGDQLRVSTQLAEVPVGTLVWSHSSQLPLGDLFQVQDELARRIVDSLSVPLTARERRSLKEAPSSSRAYEFYLRGNQLSYDSKQWADARDFYLRSVEEDPAYAPAWARLGRMYHVIGKYLDAGADDNFPRAEAAFARALELNPDLPLAHKLFAQLDVDRGRAESAMARLLERSRSADPEVFAGLVSACRYCGLLEGSVAADARARRLEPRIRTSVVHTHFVRRDYVRVAATKLEEVPYIGPVALAALGRGAEAVSALRELEPRTRTRLREFMVAARCLIEGNRADSLAAVNRVLSSDFSDPEGLYYLARHLAHLNEVNRSLETFRRVVDGGYFCYPAMAADEWLAPLRQEPEFKKLLATARSRHEHAVRLFQEKQGDELLAPIAASPR